MTAPELVTPVEAARRLGICTRTLREHVKDGRLAFISIGRGLRRKRRMFHPDDLVAFVEAQREHECRRTAPRAARSSDMTSGSKVYDFTVPLAAQTSGMPTRPKSKSAAKPKNYSLKVVRLSRAR